MPLLGAAVKVDLPDIPTHAKILLRPRFLLHIVPEGQTMSVYTSPNIIEILSRF
jgi:hypothetical protein